MYPEADIPVVQLSLDQTRLAPAHYALAKELAPLRQEEVPMLGSGNIVQSLGQMVLRSGRRSDLNVPCGLDWALEAQALFRRLIDEKRPRELANYAGLGVTARLAVPTPEHFLPLLHILALQGPGERVSYFNDAAVGGSLTMTSLVIKAAVN
jgi:4,5-DOPA dioxygenase extradiol